MRRIKISVIVLLLFFLVLFVLSQFLPFMVERDYDATDSSAYAGFVAQGVDFNFTRISFILLVYSTFIFISKEFTWRPIIFSFLNLISLILLYYSITHPSPSFIYEGVETKTAFGYHILVIISLLHFLTFVIYLILTYQQNQLKK